MLHLPVHLPLFVVTSTHQAKSTSWLPRMDVHSDSRGLVDVPLSALCTKPISETRTLPSHSTSMVAWTLPRVGRVPGPLFQEL
ncbi:hypothetical protein BDR04DRAFT_438270 [Suillus decipiens]|nr:hypothetical protein BDR04DRAFT_438270 [Suillus decipiens]